MMYPYQKSELFSEIILALQYRLMLFCRLEVSQRAVWIPAMNQQTIQSFQI